MQETSLSKRRLVVRCDRGALTSLVSSCMRSRGIPMVLFGGDLIRGAVFDMMDHPENSIEESIGRAYYYSKLPGRCCNEVTETDIIRGYEMIYEAIEASWIQDVPWIAFSDSESMKQKAAIVDRELEKIAFDVYKAYCYTAMYRFFETHKLSFGSDFGLHLMQDMVYKKLCADDSAEECMYVYAYRKEFHTDEKITYDYAKSKIMEVLQRYCEGHKVLPHEAACNIVDQIYKENNS